MVGAISAAGLMGGLALVLAQMSRQQMVFQKRSQSQAEVEAISRRIGRMLYNPQSCLKTVENVGIISSFTSTTTMPLYTIRNSSGRNVYTVNNTYGNGLVKVSSLQLKNFASIGSTGRVRATLQVGLEKTSKAVSGYKKAIRTYDLVINVDPVVFYPTACETDLSAVKQELCEELGRTYDTANQTCAPVTANLSCPPPANTGDPPLFPIGFESDGTPFGVRLTCVPSPDFLSHPAGFNCFLYALHSGNHGGTGNAFQPRTEEIGGVTYSAVINTQPPNNSSPSRPRLVTLLDRWTKTGTEDCPSGYTSRYINPIGSIPNFNDGSNETTGAQYAYMQHYCCR